MDGHRATVAATNFGPSQRPLAETRGSPSWETWAVARMRLLGKLDTSRWTDRGSERWSDGWRDARSRNGSDPGDSAGMNHLIQ